MLPQFYLVAQRMTLLFDNQSSLLRTSWWFQDCLDPRTIAMLNRRLEKIQVEISSHDQRSYRSLFHMRTKF